MATRNRDRNHPRTLIAFTPESRTAFARIPQAMCKCPSLTFRTAPSKCCKWLAAAGAVIILNFRSPCGHPACSSDRMRLHELIVQLNSKALLVYNRHGIVVIESSFVKLSFKLELTLSVLLIAAVVDVSLPRLFPGKELPHYCTVGGQTPYDPPMDDKSILHRSFMRAD
jgi:hypothetical protein